MQFIPSLIKCAPRFFAIFLVFAVVSGGLAGCEYAQNQLRTDRAADLDREDFRRAMAPRTLDENKEAPIPQLQSHIAGSQEYKEPMPLVSVSVNQTVPLRDLLFELTEQAGFDLEMDPQIRGSIVFTARRRPFDEVINRICDLAGLRYKMQDGLLRVEVDRPYVKSYKLDYVNIVRNSSSSIEQDVSVISSEEADVGSQSEVENEMESDFWMEIDANLKQLLAASDQYMTLSSAADPTATPRAAPTPQAQQGQPQTQDTPEPPILNIQAPTAPRGDAPANPAATYSINKQASMVTVFATQRQHREVYEYLRELRRNLTAQVLIEAKILEVSLSDEYTAGIDWGSVAGNGINFTGLATLTGNFGSPGFVDGGGETFAAVLQPGSDLKVAVSALSRFGTIRALSSPRVMALNNQTALLNVVQNKVFFELDVTTEEDEDTGDTTVEVESNIRSVPEGVLVTVIPAINLDTNEILMSLRPTLSRIVGNGVPDPGVAVALAVIGGVGGGALDDIQNIIPELAVQEIDTMIRMQSGQVLVLGGLMEDSNETTESGVPVASDIPLVGNLFKSHIDDIQKRELVIFLKATIMPGTNIHDTDREFYKKFGNDRRPFRM